MSTDKPANTPKNSPAADKTADWDVSAPVREAPAPPAAPGDDYGYEQYYDPVGCDEFEPENYADLHDEPRVVGVEPETTDTAAAPAAAALAPVVKKQPVSEKKEDAPIQGAAAYDATARRQRGEMTLWEHLDDLRSTIIKSLLATVLCVVLVGVFFSQTNDVLLYPLNSALERFEMSEAAVQADRGQGYDTPDYRHEFLRMHTVFGVFSVIFEIALVGGVLLALPFILYFVARFVAPGLTDKEKGVLLPSCIAALALFLTGVFFSYFFLLPNGIYASLLLNEYMGFFLQPNVQEYYSMVIWALGGSGLVFEFPLLLLLLVYLEIVTPAMLKKYRRHALVVILIVSAFATPPDAVSLFVMSIPLYLLYELSIIIGERLLEKKHKAMERAVR